MAWVWTLIVIGLISSGIASLWLAKKVGDDLKQRGFHTVFYLGPLFILFYGPLYIAKRFGHDVKIDYKTEIDCNVEIDHDGEIDQNVES